MPFAALMFLERILAKWSSRCVAATAPLSVSTCVAKAASGFVICSAIEIAQWKKQLIDNAASVFERGGTNASVDQEQLIADLYEQLGRAHAELEWLKKSAGRRSRRPSLVDRSRPWGLERRLPMRTRRVEPGGLQPSR